MEKIKVFNPENDKEFMTYWKETFPDEKFTHTNFEHINIAHAYCTGYKDALRYMIKIRQLYT